MSNESPKQVAPTNDELASDVARIFDKLIRTPTFWKLVAVVVMPLLGFFGWMGNSIYSLNVGFAKMASVPDDVKELKSNIKNLEIQFARTDTGFQQIEKQLSDVGATLRTHGEKLPDAIHAIERNQTAIDSISKKMEDVSVKTGSMESMVLAMSTALKTQTSEIELTRGQISKLDAESRVSREARISSVSYLLTEKNVSEENLGNRTRFIMRSDLSALIQSPNGSYHLRSVYIPQIDSNTTGTSVITAEIVKNDVVIGILPANEEDFRQQLKAGKIRATVVVTGS